MGNSKVLRTDVVKSLSFLIICYRDEFQLPSHQHFISIFVNLTELQPFLPLLPSGGHLEYRCTLDDWGDLLKSIYWYLLKNYFADSTNACFHLDMSKNLNVLLPLVAVD